jgi:hypothetical protein
VKVEAVETFELVEPVPKEAEKPKDLAPGEQHVETIYNVKEINIGLSDEQKAMVKELTELDDQLRKKEEALVNDLKDTWKGKWWTDNYYTKKFVRKGREVYLTDVKIQWPVIVSKVTKPEGEESHEPAF